MKREERFKERLRRELECTHLSVADESHLHQGGSESHYKVVAVSAQFEGMPLVARHRMVFNILEELSRKEIHALSLDAYSPSEWEAGRPPSQTPRCVKLRQPRF